MSGILRNPIIHAMFIGLLLAVIFELVRMLFMRLSPPQEIRLVVQQLPDGTLVPMGGKVS